MPLALTKTGGDCSVIATFHSYQLLPLGGDAAIATFPQVGSVGSAVSTRGATALSYGGGVFEVQSFRRVGSFVISIGFAAR